MVPRRPGARGQPAERCRGDGGDPVHRDQGNIELIKNYVYDHGVNYDYAPDGGDIAKNADGVWTVADAVTGATLAGTPNYFNLIKEAVDQIAAGNYTTVE